MDVNSVYSGGNFLKATDLLQDGEMVLTIRSTELKAMDDGKRKLLLSFMETERTLMLNKTNAMIIASAYGNNGDGWAGNRIKLSPGKTTFQGRLVDCINVQVPRPARPAAATQARPAAGFDERNPPPGSFDDDIPF